MLPALRIVPGVYISEASSVKKIRVFVASPSDVQEERDVVSVVVDELRRILGQVRPVELETVRWETHAWPDVGADAQDVINREIGQFDIFVGVMWRRFGTPTKRGDSGTSEEFNRAYNYFKQYGRPRIMFYFRRTPFYPSSDGEVLQFRRVVRFRRQLEKSGVLFWEYDNPLTFERNVREHLIRQILDGTSRRQKQPFAAKKPSPSVVFLSAARADLPRVRPIYDALTVSGFKPWLDVETLLPGQDWAVEIKRAISQARAYLFFVSHNSVGRPGWLQLELSFAATEAVQKTSGQQYLIPVRLDNVEPPEALKKYQWIDLFESGGLERLITALRGIKSVKKRRPKGKS